MNWARIAGALGLHVDQNTIPTYLGKILAAAAFVSGGLLDPADILMKAFGISISMAADTRIIWWCMAVGVVSSWWANSKTDRRNPASEGAQSRTGGGMTVGLWLLSVTLAGSAVLGASACATTGRSVEQTVTLDLLRPTHDALANFQDLEIETFRTGIVPALTPAVHATIERALGKAFTDHALATRAVRAWRAGDPVPSTVLELQHDIDDVLAVVKKSIPSAVKLLNLIQGGVDAAASVVTQLNGVKVMDPVTLMNFGAALVRAGIATYEQINETIKANKGELTDDQVNAILDAMAADDDRRAAIANEIANSKA